LLISVSLVAGCLAADTKVAFSALPAAVQAAAKTEAHGPQLIGASKEVEDGRAIYEVQTKDDGKSRDLSFDSRGKLLKAEQEVDMKDVPSAARSALEMRAAGGTIRKIQSVTSGHPSATRPQ